MERLRQLRASGERRSGEVLALADAHWKDIQRLGNERTFRVVEPTVSSPLHCLLSLSLPRCPLPRLDGV